MFGKKLLSIVGLLFVGSKLASAAGVCTVTYSGSICTPGANCAEADVGKIYLTGNGDSESAMVIVEDGIEIKCEPTTALSGTDLCVDKNKQIFVDRKTGLCNADLDPVDEECKSYYNCENGACTKSTENANPRANIINECDNPDVSCEAAGYNLKDSTLYKCDDISSPCTAQTNPIGVYVDALNSGKIIECAVSGCTRKEENEDVFRTLSLSNGKKYFVDISISILELTRAPGHYIVVDVDDSGNKTVLNAGIRYRYIKTGDTTLEIQSRTAAKGDTAMCSAGFPVTSAIKEFILDQWSVGITTSTRADYYINEDCYTNTACTDAVISVAPTK